MADVQDKATRSKNNLARPFIGMAAIKGKDTRPELQVRKYLHAKGYRYRLHVKDLPGKPIAICFIIGARLFVLNFSYIFHSRKSQIHL